MKTNPVFILVIALVTMTLAPFGSSFLRAQQVIFSEIHYNPSNGQPEYLEVLNNTATPYDIALWKLRGGVNYTFPDFDAADPERTFLKAFDRLLLSSVSEAELRQAYPEIPAETRIFGPWEGLDSEGVRVSGNLSNGGERLTLKTKNDALVCTIGYDDDLPHWPVAADGAGHSLQIRNPNRAIDDWRNWRASSLPGGSPGREDENLPPSTLTLSECHFDEEGRLAWVEIFNGDRAEVSLDGLVLQAPSALNEAEEPQPPLPLSGQLGAGEYTSVVTDWTLDDQSSLLLLTRADDQRVLSAYRVENAQPSTALQAFPAGGREWYVSDTPSRNAANDPPRFDAVMVHEIMYDAPGGPVAEFIELYNHGSVEVDLSGWELVSGVQFEFPQGTTIAPGGYIVVAADADWMAEHYPGLERPLGNFEGRLSNAGETLRLVDARGNRVDEVVFGSGGEWPELANGLGSSLELVHPDLDNGRGSAWRDSDESQKSELREYTARLRYDSQGLWHPTNDDELHLHLVGDGYILLKDIRFSKPVSLFNPDSRNLLLNADQESPNARSNSGWVFQGTHAFGSFSDGELHLKSTGRGDNRANRVEIDMEDLGSSTEAELTFQARWIHGKPRMIAQTADHGWSYEFLIDVPPNLGTPGQPNSSASTQAPPQIDSLHHQPAVPSSADDVIVSARVSAPGGLDRVEVAYIDDSPGGNEESLFRRWKRLPMVDDGTGGDSLAADGIYSASIQDMKVDGRIVAFYIEAESSQGASYHYPTGGSSRPALYVVDDDTEAADFELRTVRAVVGQQDLGAIADGSGSKYAGKFPRSSNHYWNATIIYDESEIFYNAVIRSAGSPFHTGERANLGLKGKWKLPKSNTWRGRVKTTFDQDPTSGRAHNDRVIRYWLYLLGHKVNDNEFIKFTVNDGRWATREEVESPGTSDFMNRLWEDGNQGRMYRVDDEWDFGDNLDNQRNSRNADWNYKSPNGDRPGRYHSEYMLRSREIEYDYTSLIDAFRLLSETDYTQEEAARYFDIQMIALNAAARGYIHDWDFQTLNRGKNTFFYQRPDGLFQYVHWDSDLAFRTGDLGAAFATGQGSTLRNFLRQPWLQRWFKFYLNELSEKYADRSPRFETWLELEDTSTSDQGCDINRYLSWGERRRSAVKRELGDAASAAFAITTNDGQDLSTPDHVITLTGTSSIDAFEVFVEGHPEAQLVWTGTTEYELRNIVLQEGQNTLEVRARGSSGEILGSLFNPKEASISVTKTTPSQPVPRVTFEPASLTLAIGEELDLDASSSWDPEGDPLTFQVDAPSGASVSGTDIVKRMTFDQPGIYPITLSLTDTQGTRTEWAREVAVYASAESFDNFSERRVSSHWQPDQIEEAAVRFQPAFYTLGDPEGMLSLVLQRDVALPLDGSQGPPTLWRALPSLDDFAVQTKVILANRQFGPFQTGLSIEILANESPARYVFGLDEGRHLTVKQIDEGTVTPLATIPHGEGRATLRIRRQDAQLLFAYRNAEDIWEEVHRIDLPEETSAQRAGLFASTREPVDLRVHADYFLLLDLGQTSSMHDDLRLTEVMYHPSGGEDLEYLELHNSGSSELDLAGLHFIDGIDFTFADVRLAPGAFLILAKDPQAFAANYDAAGAQVVGPYEGRLANGGETIALADAEDRLIFSFTYGDQEPWPETADGQGHSLEVIVTHQGVNDASNWRSSHAANGSPGKLGTGGPPVEGDQDNDRLPDAWELAHGLNPADPQDAATDLDNDLVSNFDEYLANTDPSDARSFLTLAITRDTGVRLQFVTQPDRRYTVEFTDNLDSADSWEVLESVDPTDVTAPHTTTDPQAAPPSARYYRLRVALP